MSTIDRSELDTIVRNHAIYAGGAGLIPIPFLDVSAVTSIQMDMLTKLYKAYDRSFDDERGKATVLSTLANLATSWAANLLPVGWLANKAVASVTFAATTYALGQSMIKFLESGKPASEFDPKSTTNFFSDQYDKAKGFFTNLFWGKGDAGGERAYVVEEEVVETGTMEDADMAVMSKLEKLAKMKNDGLISEEEFEETKKRLLTQL